MLQAFPRGALAALALLIGLAGCDAAGPDASSSGLAAGARGGPGAGSTACANRANNTPEKIQECVSLAAVRGHQGALQAIADANDGTRASGTPGYTASVDYVVHTLEAAGYAVERVPFTYPTVEAELQRVTPTPANYVTRAFTGTGEGDVTGNVTAVDLNLGGDRSNTSGCEAADFAGFPAGSIALVQRGTCTFAVKALNAEAAGAAAVVIFNQGNTPGREGLIFGTLDGAAVSVPVVEASFADGAALALEPSTARVQVEAVTATSENVLAETRRGDPNNVVVLGAHLDSVERGPGINDNGSGAAAVLETAVQMARVAPRNKVRFAWWGAEEVGLVGSTHYVSALTSTGLDAIALYLNFDMIGSPNYVRFVLDGDGSAFGLPGPAGSAPIEAFFESFYAGRGLASEPSPLTGRSDYGPFAAAGIPVGGLFTGAEGIKSPEQAATYGGTAGVPLDPCYHLACDTFDNVSLEVLDQNADAVAAAALHFAMSTELVNGVRGRGNAGFGPPPGLAGPSD